MGVVASATDVLAHKSCDIHAFTVCVRVRVSCHFEQFESYSELHESE